LLIFVSLGGNFPENHCNHAQMGKRNTYTNTILRVTKHQSHL